jgi:hypothetical protein
MSTQLARSTIIECRHPDCTEHGHKWEFHHGKYCSNACEVRHEGREHLEGILYDHRRCFSCFRRLKTVNPPKPDFEFTKDGHAWTKDEDGELTLKYYSQEITRQAATGFQFLTQAATKGEKQHGERVITGTICDACGNCDHTHHDPALADRAAIGRLVDLLAAADDVVFDIQILHREYEATEDIELAVGRALADD